MLTALIATLSAALYGGADFLAGLASRKDAPLPVALSVQAIGLVILGVVCLIVPPASWGDPRILWGAGAGVFGGIGVLSLYAGLATGRMSVVAPVTAALSGSLPAAFGLATGVRPGPIGLVGMVLALVAVVIVSVYGDEYEGGSTRSAVMLAAISGTAFAASIMCWAQTPPSTMFAPLALARLTGVVMFSVAGLAMGGRRVIAARGVGWLVLATAFADVGANAAQVVSLRIGPLALASVLCALYPVGTLILARFVLHEHLRGMQRVGIALALVAVVLSALG